MRILIILGHPNPGSLNHAIAYAVRDAMRKDGHDVVFHDLYAEHFDPLLVADEIPEDVNVPMTIG
jgi:putative NADPH-quinone reductase